MLDHPGPFSEHSSFKGRKIENKFTGAGIGAKFSTIMYRITTKNLKIGQRGLFEKKRFLYFRLMAQMQIFRPKMQFFGPKSIFFPKLSKFFDTIITGHQKNNIFVLTLMHGGPRGGRGGPFLAQTSAFFYATPI